MKQLVLVQLNELNFDLIRKYILDYDLPGFRELLKFKETHTRCEEEYKFLEPWIQWSSVYTGLTAKEHGIFRLGDVVMSKNKEIFERLENAGFRVGAVVAFNAENRLKSPAYFIPDPWTITSNDGSFWSKQLDSAIRQVVNDNASSKISLASYLKLLAASIRFIRLSRYSRFIKQLYNLCLGKVWAKALILDLLLHEFHLNRFRNHQPNLSTIFFNAGAHIQHHYMLSSKFLTSNDKKNPEWYVARDADPFLDMLRAYDDIITDYLCQSCPIIFATGLTQRAYDRATYYYRLTECSKFLDTIGITYKSVTPRMSRDFLIEFKDETDAANACKVLKKIEEVKTKEKLFDIVDNRGNTAFIELTYPNEITEESSICVNNKDLKLLQFVSFVAIKNGMHCGKGFIFNKDVELYLENQSIPHVKELNSSISRFFGI